MCHLTAAGYRKLAKTKCNPALKARAAAWTAGAIAEIAEIADIPEIAPVSGKAPAQPPALRRRSRSMKR